MKRLMCVMCSAALSLVMLTGCESKDVREYKAVLNEIVEVNKKAGITIPRSEIDKAIEEFKSGTVDREAMLKAARHKLERNKAGKELKHYN